MAESPQYELAVLFNELATGEVPFASVFETGDPLVVMYVVGREPFSPSSELPRAVRNALARALAKKPEERFASCCDFVAALGGSRTPLAGGVWWLLGGREGKQGTKTTEMTASPNIAHVASVTSVTSVTSVASVPSHERNERGGQSPP